MARKKPEAMVALEAVKPSCCQCSDNAITSVKTEDGWRDFCLEHYTAHFTYLATRGTGDQGTSFVDKWAAW